jgi:hypothetical protein
MAFLFTDGLSIPFFSAGRNFSRNVSLSRTLTYGARVPVPDWLLNVNWVSGSANATTVQRDEEGGEDQMTAVGVAVGDHVVVDVNPHLHSPSVSEDKKTSPTSGSGGGNFTPNREVTFLEPEGGEKGRGKQGDEVNVVVPAASTSAPVQSLVQIPATRVQMKEVLVSEDAVMPTMAAQVPPTMTTTSTQHATGLGEVQQNVVADPVLKVVRFHSAQ